MTSHKLHEEHEILRRFMAVVVSSAFWDSLTLGCSPPLDARELLTQRARRGISMPRGKNCRETIFAAQLPRKYPHHGGNFERGKIALSCGGEAIWEAF